MGALTGDGDFFFLRGDDFDGGHEAVGDDGDSHEEVDEDEHVGETARRFLARREQAVVIDTFGLNPCFNNIDNNREIS